MESTLPSIDQLTQQKLMNYVEHFLDIAEFRKIENGKLLLSYLREHPEHPKIKIIVRKVLGLFNTELPGAKVCSLQFIKQAIETDNWIVVEAVLKSLLPKVTEIIQYRSHIRSIQRGMTYFISQFDKNATDEEIMTLTKLSSTFFRMIHQCVYVWGIHYFPGSPFDRLRIKLQKRFQFTQKISEFKFFNAKKIQTFQQNCKKVQKKMAEYRDDLASQSSIEKKRQNSIKPSRVSSQVKNVQKSQSTDELKNLSPKKMTKQLQKQYNQTLKKTQNKDKKQKKFSHKPKSKRTSENSKTPRTPRVQLQPSSPKKQQIVLLNNSIKSISDNNSSKLRKKNSFDLPYDLDKKINQKNKHENFNPIAQDIQSEGGRINATEESDLESSQLNDFPEDLHNSPRSQHSFQETLPLKKYSSQQIIADAANRSQSLKEPVQKFSNKIHQGPSVPSKFTKKNEKVPHLPIDQLRKNKYNDQQQISEKNRAQNKNSTYRESQKTSSRRLTSKRKFVSSEEENIQAEDDDLEEIELPSQSNRIKKQFKKSSIKTKQENIPFLKPAEEIKLLQKTDEKRNSASNDKPTKLSKPKKIKADNSSKSIFEEVIDYKTVNHQTEQNHNVRNPYIPKEQLQKIIHQEKLQQKIQQHNKIHNQKKEEKYAVSQSVKGLEEKKEVKRNSQNAVIVKQKQITNVKDQQKKEKEEKKQKKKEEKKQIKFSLTQIEQIPSIKQIPLHEEVQQIQYQSSNAKNYQRYEPIKENVKNMIQIDKKLENKNINTIDYSPQQDTFRTLLYDTPRNPPQSQRNARQAASIIKNSKQQQQLRSFHSSRFQKYSQVNLSISPGSASNSLQSSQMRYTNTQQLKSQIQKHLKEEFNNLQTTLLQQQQSTINQSMQSFKNKLLEQQKPRQSVGIQCSIPQKFKTKVKYYRKKQFMDQSDEVKIYSKETAVKSQSVGIQAGFINDQERVRDKKILNISNMDRKKLSGKSSKNGVPVVGEYQPNTLLYALYRKKSMNM